MNHLRTALHQLKSSITRRRQDDSLERKLWRSQQQVLYIGNHEHTPLIRLILEREGFQQVHYSPDETHGLEMALQEQPDIVIIFDQPPALDGFKVYNTMKNDVLMQHLPILFLTSRRIEFESWHQRSYDIIHLPVGPQELSEAIEALIQRSLT